MFSTGKQEPGKLLEMEVTANMGPHFFLSNYSLINVSLFKRAFKSVSLFKKCRK